MTMKTASFLALTGMVLLTMVILADLARDVSSFVSQLIPATALLRSMIYTFGSVTVTNFL